LSALAEPLAYLQTLTSKPYPFYLTELRRHEDALFGSKEQLLDPVRRFMSGAQRQIYDEARAFLSAQESNFAYLQDDGARQVQTLLADPACYRGHQMTQVKTLLDALRTSLAELVRQERTRAIQAIDHRWERLASMGEFADLTPDQQGQLQQPFDELKRTIERQTVIAVIRDSVHRFDEREYQQLLRRMTLWAQPAPAPDPGHTTGNDHPRKVVEREVEYVAKRTLAVNFDKLWLADEEDVDSYLAALKQALLEAIHAGKRIQL
jgi:hypothetical protein